MPGQSSLTAMHPPSCLPAGLLPRNARAKGLTRYPATGLMMLGMRASEAATQAQVNPQTLRYYERLGLIPEPDRTASGYRSYPHETVNRVRFIKRAQAVGFSLADVETLLHLDSGQPTDCGAARELALRKAIELEQRIREMSAMRDALGRFVAECDAARAPGSCPLINELSQEA